jgi:hypothetical protein
MEFELNIENENDDCEILFQIFKSNTEIFIKNIRKYTKLDINTENDKHIFLENEKDLELIIENLNRKNSLCNKIKFCKLKEHQKLAFEIDHMTEDNKRKINSFYKQKKDNQEFLKDLKYENKPNLINSEENENEYKYEFEKNKNNEQNEKESLINKDYLNGNLEDIDIFKLEEIIDKHSKEYIGDKIFQKNLIKFKNQIQELQNNLNYEIENSGQKIDMITNDVNEVSVNVDIANEDLRKAALEKNKVSHIKYAAIFGGVGTTIGTVVPGIGNLIGGSIGTLLGIGIAKLEKRQIKKIEAEKYKEKILKK